MHIANGGCISLSADATYLYCLVKGHDAVMDGVLYRMTK
jgi:hypothetical protein